MIDEHTPFPELRLNDVPDIFCSMAELAARNASAEAIIADTDCVVLELVGEIVSTLGHSAHEDADTFLGTQAANVIPNAYNLRIEGEGDFPAVMWQMVGDWVLDNFQ